MDPSVSDRDPVERLAEEFLERHRRGEEPDLAEYTTRYPQWADAILEVFPALLMMEQMRPVSENVTASRTLGVTAPDIGPGGRLERLGDYRILREVGRGGMGLVYEAVQESLGRHVALKILPASAMLDARQRQRFEREARASARLHHTNIVPVFGIGEHDGLFYYVMQFIQGQSLDQVLRELPRMKKAPGKEKSTKPATGRVKEDRGLLPTAIDSTLAGSAADIAAQLLSGQFAAPQGLPGDEGSVTSDLPKTLPAASSDRQDETLGLETQKRTGSADQPSGRKPMPASAVGRFGPTPSASGGESSPVSGLLTGSADSLGRPGVFRHYSAGVARIGIQVCEALQYAHGQGIVHRDVKPSNLLLDLQGTVWVTDFGLAKAADETNLTQTGDLLGTLRYMAPERFQGRSDARSDIYALGLTLYEMLAMRPAFESSDRNSLIHKVTSEAPPPLRKIDPRVPLDLETIVAKAIDREPARRYQTAGEMAEDLQRFLQDKPIRARRIHLPEQIWRWSRRNPAMAAMTAALLLLLAAVAIGSSVAAVWFKNLARSEGLARQVADLNRRQAEQQRHEADRARQQAEAAQQQEAAERDRAEQARAAAQANLVEARRQRGRAEASFQQARAAVDESLTRISENNLLNVPGLRPLRRELIEAALRYYQGFVQRRGHEPELREELAAAYTRVGRITADLGSKAAARKSYEQAIAIQTELLRLAVEAGRPAALAELARSHQAVGRLARELNEESEAETALGQAETLWRRATNLKPGDPELQNGLADCLNETGALHESAGRLERAAQRYREALSLQRKLVADHPKHPQIARFRHVLARQYLRMGHLQLGLKLSPETFTHVLGREFPLSSEPLFFEEQSQEMLRGLVRDFPAHEAINEFRRDLAEATETIAAFQADKNQSEEALRSYQEALAIREQLARENPTVPDLQAELARAYAAMGKVSAGRGRWSEALPRFRQAVERQRLVVLLAPLDESQRGVLSRRLGELGRSESKLGRTAEAVRDLSDARELLVQLSHPGPDDLYDLAALSALVGREPEQTRGELTTAALAAFQKAIAAGFLDLERASTDADLDPLRSRDDFKALLERLARIRQGIVWVLDLEQAKAQAARENKDLFIYFSGSDWCPWCVLFHRTLLSKPAFIEEVPKHFVMVQLDRPMTKPKPANFARVEELSRRWQVNAIPTIILADAQGKPYARIMNDPSEEARAKYIDNLRVLQGVRADRDRALARAKSAQGLERAKHLDAALQALPWGLVEAAYGDLITEIIALDAHDEAGLRTRYERSGPARTRAEARAAFGKRDWAGVIHLLGGLQKDPQPAGPDPAGSIIEDDFRRGSAHAELGHFEEAAADFAKALESMALLRPPLTTERVNQYALLLVATGRLDDYRRICEGLLELAEVAPDPMTAQYVLMSLRLAPSAVPDGSPAVQLAEKHFGDAPKRFGLLRILGQTYYRTGRFADAIGRLNRAVAIYDADPRLQASGEADGWFSVDGLFLAMAYHRLGQGAEARRFLDQARQRWDRALKSFRKDPAVRGNTWFNRLVSSLLRCEAEALIEGSPDTDDPVAAADYARAEIRLDHWDRALAHLNRALKHVPGDLRLRLERGRCSARLGRPEQAAADFAEVIGIKLQALQARRAAGEGMFPALEDLAALSEAYHDLAAIQCEAGLPDEAVATYRKIQALWPGHPEQLFRVARGLSRCLTPARPRDQKEGPGPASSLEGLVVDVLKQAALAGFTDPAQVQVFLSAEPLRSNPAYRTLVQQLQRSEVLPLTSGELRRYVGHQHDWVECVAAARDGRRALSVGDDRKPRLWDVESGRELQRFDGHGAEVYGAALSPDGRRAVTCSRDGTLRVWDVGTGRELQRIAARSGRDQKLALAPDGRRVLAGQTDGTLGLWDLETGQLLRQFPGSADPPLTAAFSPDGRRALSAGREGVVSLWDVERGTMLKRLQGHRGTVWCATFTREGGRALTAGGDGRLILWDLETGRPLRAFVGHWEPVRCVALLPGGSRIVSGSQGGRLIVWDLETGRELYRLTGPAGVLSLDPLPEGHRVLTAESKGIVRLRDLSEESARFRDLARLGEWEPALARNPTPQDPSLRLGLAHYRAQNQQWDTANADPSLAVPAAAGMGLRQIPVLDPRLEEQLRSGRGPAAKIIFINLTRRSFHGFVLDRGGRRREVFTLTGGEGFVLDCEVKDCFLLTEREGKRLGLIVAGTGASLVVLSEAPQSTGIGLPHDPEYLDLLLQAVAAHGRSEPAEAFVAQVQNQRPDDLRIDRSIGHVYARWGLWDRAASALARCIDRDPSDHWDWCCAAVLDLRRGDRDGYRRCCRRMLDRFAASEDPVVAERTARVCLLTSEPVDDQKRPDQLAERAVRGGAQHASLKWFQQAKALSEYRQGHFPGALEWIEKSQVLNAGDPQRYLESGNLLIAALAHQRLGHAVEALRSLDQARRVMERLPAPGQPDYEGPWTDWLMCQTLRPEAEGLIVVPSPGAARATGPPSDRLDGKKPR